MFGSCNEANSAEHPLTVGFRKKGGKPTPALPPVTESAASRPLNSAGRDTHVTAALLGSSPLPQV